MATTMCEIDPTKPCTDCGDCDVCDLNPKKICDNCLQCLNQDSDYNGVQIDEILLPESDKQTT